MLAIRCHWCLGIFSPLDASGAYKTEDEALHRSAVKLFGVLYISSALIIVSKLNEEWKVARRANAKT